MVSVIRSYVKWSQRIYKARGFNHPDKQLSDKQLFVCPGDWAKGAVRIASSSLPDTHTAFRTYPHSRQTAISELERQSGYARFARRRGGKTDTVISGLKGQSG